MYEIATTYLNGEEKAKEDTANMSRRAMVVIGIYRDVVAIMSELHEELLQILDKIGCSPSYFSKAASKLCINHLPV